MVLGRQSDPFGALGGPTIIYGPPHNHPNMPTMIQSGPFTGIEPPSTSEYYFSLAPTLWPEQNYSNFTSSMSEYSDPPHSSDEILPDALHLQLGVGEPGFQQGRKNASTEPIPLPDAGASRFQALGGESMGSSLSENGVTSSETHQE